MSDALPEIINAYFAAVNAFDTTAMAACFTSDAVVLDEGLQHDGIAAVREWIEATTSKYHIKLKVIDSSRQLAETVVSAQVSGSFDGSPIDLQYRFRVDSDKITYLSID
jgi:ketosteroid isomerase-like protein